MSRITLFNRQPPLSAAAAGFLLAFSVWHLLLPVAVYLQSHQSAAWRRPEFWTVSLLLCLSLGGLGFGGIFFYRLVREAFPGLSKFRAKFWSFLSIVLTPLSPLLLLLPCSIGQRNRTGIFLAIPAGIFQLTVVPLTLLQGKAWPHWLPSILFWLGVLFFLAALKGAAPREKLTGGGLIFILFVFASAIGLEVFAWSLDRQVRRTMTALEESFGEPVFSPEYSEKQRPAARLSEEPWKTLLHTPFPTRGYQHQPDSLRLPAAEEIQAFESSARQCAAGLAAANEVTGRRSYRLAPGDRQVAAALSDQLRRLALFYAFSLRAAAARGDRNGVVDASQRLERLSEFAGSDTLEQIDLAYRIEDLRRRAFAPVLQTDVLPDTDLAGLAVNFRRSDDRLRKRYEETLKNEIIRAWNRRRPGRPAGAGPDSRQKSDWQARLYDSSPLLRSAAQLELLRTLRYYLEYRKITADERLEPATRRKKLAGLEENIPRRLPLSRTLLPSATALWNAENLRRDGAGAGALAIAVELFRRRYGELPKDLAELVPEFLPELPLALTDRQPFRYEAGRILPGSGRTSEATAGYRIRAGSGENDSTAAEAENAYTVVLEPENR